MNHNRRHTDRSTPRMLFIGAVLAATGALLLSCDPAEAADTVALEWDAPTQRVDGTELAPDEIDRYEVQCGERREETAEQTFSFELPAGQYECYVRVYDTAGRVSAWSEALTANVLSPPAAPQNIRVTVTVEIGGGE